MKFRSKYEKRVYGNAEKDDRAIDYEPRDATLRYTTTSEYLPDFRLPNGVLVECKGYFKPADRRKMLEVKEQHPLIDLRILFQRASNTLTKAKRSKTYGQWADKHGFIWAEGDSIPDEWYD